jgi:hypothetical protein
MLHVTIFIISNSPFKVAENTKRAPAPIDANEATIVEPASKIKAFTIIPQPMHRKLRIWFNTDTASFTTLSDVTKSATT